MKKKGYTNKDMRIIIIGSAIWLAVYAAALLFKTTELVLTLGYLTILYYVVIMYDRALENERARYKRMAKHYGEMADRFIFNKEEEHE